MRLPLFLCRLLLQAFILSAPSAALPVSASGSGERGLQFLTHAHRLRAHDTWKMETETRNNREQTLGRAETKPSLLLPPFISLEFPENV